MNRMQQDLRDLGVRLWPDDAPLWPRDSVAGQITIEARPRLVAATLGAITFVVVFGSSRSVWCSLIRLRPNQTPGPHLQRPM